MATNEKPSKQTPPPIDHVALSRVTNGYIAEVGGGRSPYAPSCVPGNVYVFESVDALARWLKTRMPQPQ